MLLWSRHGLTCHDELRSWWIYEIALMLQRPWYLVFFVCFWVQVLFLSWCKNPRSVKSQSGELIFLKDRLKSEIIFSKKNKQKNRRKTQFFSRTLISEFSEICLGHCCWLSWSSRIWRNVEDTGSLRNVEMTEHHWKKLQIPTNLLQILQILGC